MMGPHENLNSILRSPYPSDADKTHAKRLMRAWSRSQRSRDNLKRAIEEQNVALDKRNAHIAALEKRVTELEAAIADERL